MILRRRDGLSVEESARCQFRRDEERGNEKKSQNLSPASNQPALPRVEASSAACSSVSAAFPASRFA